MPSTPATGYRNASRPRPWRDAAALFAAFLLAVAASVTGLEVTVLAPEAARVDKEGLSGIVAMTGADLWNRFGLKLPEAVTIELVPTSRFKRMLPSGEFVRYDGLAAAGNRYVALDLGLLGRGQLKVPEVLRHELFHVAAGPLRPPRWFDEGMAMLFAGSLFPLETEQPPMRRATLSLGALEGEFNANEAHKVREAYTDAYHFVRYLSERFGEERLVRFLALRYGEPADDFRQQFQKAAGHDIEALYRDYRQPYTRFWPGLWPLLKQIPLFAWLALILVAGGILKWRRLKRLGDVDGRK